MININKHKNFYLFVFLCLLIISCKTPKQPIIEVILIDFEDIDNSEVKIFSLTPQTTSIESEISFENTVLITQHGHIYSSTEKDDSLIYDTNNPNIFRTELGVKQKQGNFISNIRDLKVGMTYYVKAYVIIQGKIFYSKQNNFTTPTAPSVDITTIQNITSSGAQLLVNISFLGTSSVLSHGVVWAISGNGIPTLNNTSHFSNNLGATSGGTFTTSITGLSSNSTYYIRAYASNTEAVSYSPQRNFTTLTHGSSNVSAIAPTVSITSLTTELSGSNASISIIANLEYEGSSKVKQHGFTWSTSTDPNIDDANDSKVLLGNKEEIGTFSTTINGLSPNTLYYIKAFATNDEVNRYSLQQTIVTANTNVISGNYLELEGASLNFGAVAVNSTHKKKVLLNNTTGNSITITSVSLPSGYTTDWSGGVITALSGKEITISYNPINSTSYNGNLIFNHALGSYSSPILGSARVSNYNAITGNTLTSAGNTNPYSLWANGNNSWVLDYSDDKIYVYNLSNSNRENEKEFSLTIENANPYSIWADGATMYVSDRTDDKVYAYKLSDGSNLSGKEFDLHSSNGDATGIWSDGLTLWVSDISDDKIYAYNINSGTRQESKEFNLHSDNASPYGLWSDGTTLWVIDNTDIKIYAYNLSDGTRQNSKEITLDSAITSPTGIWSDGTTMWIVDKGTDKIYTALLP